MASFSKRNGKWQYRISYRDKQTGKFRTKSKGGFVRKQECMDEANKLELEKGDSNLSKRDILFYKYFIDWYETFRVANISDGSRKRYIKTGEILKEKFPYQKLVDITKGDYQEFINEYGKTRAKATVSRLNTYVRGMCQEAIDERIIYSDFTRNVNLVARKATRSSNAKFLEISDFKKVIARSKQRGSITNTSALEIYFVCESGARYEEAAALTWDCVNFDDNTITINKAYDDTAHKLKPTKNESSNRTITIPKDCMNTLKTFKLIQAQNFKNRNYIDPYNFVFRNRSRYLPNNSAVNIMLSHILDDCKITKRIKFHDLRHTHVSYLFSQGFSLLYISHRIGHKNPNTTLKVYSHLMNQTMDDENNMLNGLFN